MLKFVNLGDKSHS